MAGSDTTIPAVTCAWCRTPMDYVHGHAACLDSSCPMFGLNQAECCDGETIATCPTPTARLAPGPPRYREDR